MKFSIPFLTLMIVALTLVVAHPADAQVWRVDKSATGANNGTSWQNAFTTIQPAINAAHAAGGGLVWVAGGPIASPVVYNEARTELWGGYAGSLIMKDNVHVFGGFEGWRGGAGAQETVIGQRVLAQNIAVIDGSTARSGVAAFHVVVFGRSAAATVNAVLDGFHITGGDASGAGGQYHTYRGGGIYNWRSAPIIRNCYIHGNTASVSGGGVANEGIAGAPGNAQYNNCVIADNTAQRNLDNVGSPVRGGGGVYINRSTPSLTHVTIAGNTAGAGGTAPGNTTNYGLNSGGIYTHTHSGLPTAASALLSGIIWANTGGGIINQKTDTLGGGGAVAMTADYSNIAGGYPGGTGNLNANPNFSGAFPWAYQITGAPCVDAGSSSIDHDIRGVPRPLGASVDMGAYEYSANGPVAVCMPHTVTLDGGCSGSLIVANIDGGSSAQAGIWKRAASQTTFGSGDIGGNAVQLTVTDILGRIANCNATVTVQDTIVPVITNCPGDQTLNLNASCQVAIPNLAGLVTATDNCGIASTTQNPPAGTLVSVDTLVTFTVTDLGGNTAQCTAWVYVQDVTPPVITTCPPGRTLPLDGSCQTTVPNLVPEVAATDNCGIASITQNPTSGTVITSGTNVLITVTDTSGLTDTCTVALGVIDNTDPVITTCPSDVILVPNASCQVTVPDFTGGVVATDNCTAVGNLDITQNPTAGTVVTGDTPVLISVRDEANNTATCTVNVLVDDQTAPVIVDCADDVTVQLNASCQATVPDLTGDVDATDNCTSAGNLDITQVPTAGTTITADTLVTITVADAANNTTQCTAWVYVEDSIPPVVTITGGNSLTAECSVALTLPNASALDNCDGALGASVSNLDGLNPASPAVGTYNVEYSATDASGNTGTETLVVEIEDTVDPVVAISGPGTITVECGVPMTLPSASALDDCDGALPAAVSDLDGLDTASPAVGTYNVVYSATDGSSNTGTDTLEVVVEDSTPPVITRTGPAVIFVELNDPYNDQGATAWDVCDGDISAAIVPDGLPIDTSVISTTVITYDVDDSAGLPATTVTRTVHVVDTSQPNLVDVQVETGWTVLVTFSKTMGWGMDMPGSYTLSGDGQGTLADHPLSVEHVSGNSYRLTWSDVNQEMFNGGDITIEVDDEVQDDVGNFMNFRVLTHEDGAIGEAPVITLFGTDEFLECGVDTFVEAGAEAVDNVDGPVSVDTAGADLVSDADVGVYTVTYTAVDAAGNTAVETRTVTVEDDTEPEIALNGEAFITLECNLAWYDESGATAWDACDGDLTSEVLVGAPANTSILGVQVVAYSVTDGEGNTATVERTIEVVDTTAPTIALLGANPYVTSDGTTYVEPGATAWDVCDGDLTDDIVIGGDDPNTTALGVYVVTYTVSDSSDNVASTSRSVVVKPEDCDMAFALEITPNPAVPGETVTLEVVELPGSCSVGALDYIWQKAPMAAKSDFSVIPDAPNAAIFTIANVSYVDAGAYMCTVSDASDTVDTQPVTLVVTTGIPAVGGLGLAIAAAAAALAGVVALRKRR